MEKYRRNTALLWIKGKAYLSGDMGVVREINTYEETITVEYDEHRQVVYPYSMMDELELAYAITVHKSQGSGVSGGGDPTASRAKTAVSQESALYSRDTGKEMCHLGRKRGSLPGNDPE